MPQQTPTSSAESEAVTVEGAISAPILYFDEVPTLGFGSGIGRLVLTALVQEVGPDGQLHTRKVAVAHLRGSASAFHLLREAIGKMELLSAPTPETAN